MDVLYTRTDAPLQVTPDGEGQRDGVRTLTVDPPVPEYTCSRCGADWEYRDVRNTGRCPSCGSGLLRNGDWP